MEMQQQKKQRRNEEEAKGGTPCGSRSRCMSVVHGLAAWRSVVHHRPASGRGGKARRTAGKVSHTSPSDWLFLTQKASSSSSRLVRRPPFSLSPVSHTLAGNPHRRHAARQTERLPETPPQTETETDRERETLSIGARYRFVVSLTAGPCLACLLCSLTFFLLLPITGLITSTTFTTNQPPPHINSSNDN
ncbi:hypothetical protein TEQG_04216 [Trichophyton equinum CBS 127.97]|uniref:Uncharacterized protein n=1 Tax=Trichophyton equinum (strain ATCC MYA-4606 / CBS 127.97) TaxID=559882 RepID=F2PTW8_TRIEC|nr:hypothetical protein TEQG_04216 [Trichophyton equinum CBS 127.97]